MQNNTLPPWETRWVARRKADVIAAIRNGLLSIEEACNRYALTTEELIAWQAAYTRHGVNGLKLVRQQVYRPHRRRAALTLSDGPSPPS